jgi:hypothetical protein
VKKTWLMIGVMLMAALLLTAPGCGTTTAVVISNQTGVGLDIEYNQQLQSPFGRMGYINSVFGIIPTNRVADNQPGSGIGGGAKDSPNVLFETNFSNFFSFWNDNGIYQRVAVGDIAVTQPGAVAMFAKNITGTIDAEAVNALNGIKAPPSSSITLKARLVELAKDETKKKTILERAAALGIPTWNAFLDGRPKEPTINQLQAILDEVGK